MEEIRWITTPKCSKCKPEPCFVRRFSCIGCDKLQVRPKAKPRRLIARQTVKPPERDSRDQTVLALRAQGLSYGAIAGTLGLPRSTVQGIVLRKSAAAVGEAAAVRSDCTQDSPVSIETGNALETAEIYTQEIAGEDNRVFCG